MNCSILNQSFNGSEMPLLAYNKQYLGLAGVFGSTLGYPIQPIHTISLITVQSCDAHAKNQAPSQTLEFEVGIAVFQHIKHHQEQFDLRPNEHLWLWVSVDAAHGLEAWQLFKSHLPIKLIQNLYEHAQHIDSLLTLLKLIQSLKTRYVQDFAESLLYNDALMKRWFTLPASRRHHHSFPGGLMVHSLEVAQMTQTNLTLLKHEVRTAEQDITVLAALLHDIGKTQTLSATHHTELGRLIDHEKLTLVVLAEPLSQLKHQWSAGAATLQYLLTWKTSDKFCTFIGGEIIKNADQVSTKLSLRRMAFEGKPEYYTYSSVEVSGGVQYLNRL